MARTIAKDHETKRSLILQTAARVFAEQGFDRASMNMLAEACQISKANIYHYYSSKNALLFDLLETYLMQLRDRIADLDANGLTTEQRFRQVVHEILAAYQGRDNEHRVQIAAMHVLTEEEQVTLRGYQRDLVRIVRQIIAQLAPGELARDKPKLRSVTMSVFGMLNWFYMWNSTADRAERERYAALVCDLVLGGLEGAALSGSLPNFPDQK